MPKGQKQCSCGAIMGCRTKICPQCNKQLIDDLKYNINSINVCKNIVDQYNDGKDIKDIEIKVDIEKRKKKTNRKIDIDWHTLEQGDLIKITNIGGPVWINKDGEEILMGHKGSFRIKGHNKDGLYCRGIGKNSGHYFIWMNGEKLSEKTGILRRPHTILKLRKCLENE